MGGGQETRRRLELGLFNALNIEAAYFTEDRTGIFMRRTSLPSSTGLLGVTPYGNIGRVKSHGVDLSAVYNKQFNKDWSLSLRGTFTFSRNEVVEKDEGDLMYDYMSVVGHPVNAITGVLVADGLFTSQEEIDNSPKQQFGNYTVGDIKYRDLNGDGIVDGNDVTTAGSPTVPEIQYGIGATVKWRRLDFSFMFQGASNVSLRMYNMHPFCDASHFGYGITQYIADNHWSEDNNAPTRLSAPDLAVKLQQHPEFDLLHPRRQIPAPENRGAGLHHQETPRLPVGQQPLRHLPVRLLGPRKGRRPRPVLPVAADGENRRSIPILIQKKIPL